MKNVSARAPRGPSQRELETLIRTSGPGPLYLLHGNEPLLIDRAAALITRSVTAGDDSGMNHQVFSAEDSDARSIATAAAAYPMLGERRLVVVRECEKLRDTDTLVAYVRDPSPTTTLLFITTKPDFRQKLFLALRDKAFILECRTPYDDRMGAWIEEEVRGSGRSISPEAAELLRLSAGRSLSEIGNELEKVYTYVGEKRAITREDVAAVVGVSRQANVFDLHRALGESDTARALGIVFRMLERGENMTGTLVQMTHYFGRLWLLAGGGGSGNSAGVAALLGVKPYFVREYVDAARHYPAARLERCFLALREADLKLKSSGGTPRQIMTLLILRITRESGAA